MTPLRRYIPDDLPFVVRTSHGKFRTWIGGTIVGGVLLGWCVLGPIMVLLAKSLAIDSVGTTLLVAGPLLVITGVLSIPYVVLRARFIGRGPLLAADERGVWGRPAKLLGNEPVWLPWSSVAAITVAKHGFEDLVFIYANPRTSYAPPDTRLVVSTLMADQTAAMIVTTLNRYADQATPH